MKLRVKKLKLIKEVHDNFYDIIIYAHMRTSIAYHKKNKPKRDK
jgi:hypothetical protein